MGSPVHKRRGVHAATSKASTGAPAAAAAADGLDYAKAGGAPYPNPEQSAPKWRMALYVRQPFPDNHVPHSFLSQLVTNAGVSRPQLLPTVLGACVVAQQLSVAVLFLLAFTYTQAGWLPLPHFLALDLSLALAGFALTSTPPKQRKGAVGWFLLFTMGLRVLSPVLRTLTLSYSDDTIHALALTLLGLHLLFHDYAAAAEGADNDSSDTDADAQIQQPEPHHGTLALNAAVFAAVLLASRLPSNEAVFCLTLLAVELFAFFPLARHHVRQRSTRAHVGLTCLLVLSTSALLHLAGRAALAALYLLTVAFITLACPVWLRWIYRRKFTIQGPWEVAKVESIGRD